MFVFVEALKALREAPCVRPFAIHGVDMDEEKAEEQEAGEPLEGSKASGKQNAKKTKPKQSKASKKKQVKVSPAEVAQIEKDVEAMVRGEIGEVAYSPTTFTKAERSFTSAVRERSGLSGKECSDLWMLSALRADLLSTLTEPELKKRRFIM